MDIRTSAPLGGLTTVSLRFNLLCCDLQKKTTQIEPLIKQKYDEIDTVCEKANSLLTAI